MKEDAKPVFCRARTIPYAKREAVENELRRMEQDGILERVHFSEYASPIVNVIKPNGSIRTCGDYKSTVNPQLNIDKHPLPKCEDIFARLSGCRFFSRLDLSDAYSQVELDEESQRFTVINTTLGLFRFKRLPKGIASSSAIFQRVIEMVLAEVKNVTPFQDDTLIGGHTKVEHLQILDDVLQKFRDFGLRLNRQKCKFLQKEIEFLGHKLDEQGIHPQEIKMKAIMKAPTPTNVEQLRSFLGLLNYYGRFLPNNSTTLAPLYLLLQHTTPWTWGQEQRDAFQAAKLSIQQSNLLVHYDVNKEITLACDASPVGVAAVISHVMDGEERPIAFASRSLAPAEKNYSQLDKEALALIFGIKKFKDYLYGKRFTLYTDHQPLVSLLAANKPIPPMAAARIQRWSLFLAAYSYDIKFRKGSANANADALSRSPLPFSASTTPVPTEYIFLVREIAATSPLTPQALGEATRYDQCLQTVKRYMMQGWPDKVSHEIQIYHRRRDELSNFNDILLMGNRAIIPDIKRTDLLTELHSSHQGVVRMKAVARSRIWWPGIDRDIEEISRRCEVCNQHAPLSAKRFNPWPVTKSPWERVHIDFAGPLEGKYLLIIVDSYSKWLEVYITSSQSSQAVIKSLREVIARFGIMFTLVSDNGTCFSSEEFADFVSHYGIRHLRSAPHHPASNGPAERGVRTIKDQLAKISDIQFEALDIIQTGLNMHKTGSLDERLAKILLNHRRSPTSTGKSPAELMLGRSITTRIDLCHPSVYPSHSSDSRDDSCSQKFHTNDPVFAYNYGTGARWFHGKITRHLGAMMYTVQTPQGEIRRHQNQLRSRAETPSVPDARGTPDSDTSVAQPSTIQEPVAGSRASTLPTSCGGHHTVTPRKTRQNFPPHTPEVTSPPSPSIQRDEPAESTTQPSQLPLEMSIARTKPIRQRTVPARYRT